MIKKKKKLVAEEMPEFQASIEAMSADSKIFVDKSLEIAHYIFQLMEEKGLKQKDLADKMGKSEAEVSKLLGGMHNLTLRMIAKLEAALEATVVCTPAKQTPAAQHKKPDEDAKEIISKVPAKTSPKMKYPDGCKIVCMYGENNNNNPQLPKAI